MKRIIFMMLCNFYRLPIWYFRIRRYARTKKDDRFARFGLLHSLNRIAIKSGRITIHCTGLDNLPSEDGYIMFPNHQGMFDVMAFIETHPRPITTVMKKELENTPLLRSIIALLQAEVIDRSDVRQALTVINHMTARVKEGENFIIFPEGTRSKNGNVLGTFKGGSFKSAINAKAPIVPVALIDCFKVFDTNSIAPVTIQIHYLKPLYFEDYKNMKSTEIAAYVEAQITESISQYIKA